MQVCIDKNEQLDLGITYATCLYSLNPWAVCFLTGVCPTDGGAPQMQGFYRSVSCRSKFKNHMRSFQLIYKNIFPTLPVNRYSDI